MIRYSVLAVFVVLAMAALVDSQAAQKTAPAPRPTPVGLQYDEITRMVVPPSTPPPPGSFQADYAVAMNPPADAGGEGIDAESAAAMKAMGIKLPSGVLDFAKGQLARYAFYKGWVRVDDLVAHTAEIRKCDLNQFIDLDLTKKTYHISTSSSGTGSSPSFGGEQASGQPGAGVMTISRKATGLGPMMLEHVATNGYSVVNTMTIAQATGSCQNEKFTSAQTEYVSGIRQPRAFCQLSNPGTDVATGQGGCRPTFKYVNTGGQVPSDRLVMYSRMATLVAGASDESAAATAFVTQRGDVKVLYTPDAVALFTVPPDFTQQQ